MSSPSPAGSRRSRSSDVAAISLRTEGRTYAAPCSSPCRHLHLAVIFTLLSSHLAVEPSPCCGWSCITVATESEANRSQGISYREDSDGRGHFLSVTRVRPGKSLARVSPSLLNASTALSYCYSFHSRPSHPICALLTCIPQLVQSLHGPFYNWKPAMNDQATVCSYSFRSLLALGHRSLSIPYYVVSPYISITPAPG